MYDFTAQLTNEGWYILYDNNALTKSSGKNSFLFF
jgi:hypothetical protein